MVLVVCEKNDAARRIASILSGGSDKSTGKRGVPIYSFTRDGEEWDVIGLRGHIVKLDYHEDTTSWRDTDLEKLAMMEPVKKASLKNFVGALKTLAKKHDSVIIATDYDREGELIGLEALEIIKSVNPDVKVKRAKFSSLTRDEITESFKNLRDVDYNLASAAETRQYIDLAWGAVLTRYLSLTSGKSGKDFLSAGRVQTPTLALIVDREKEIENFVPTPYWEIDALLFKDIEFKASHEAGRIEEKETADKIYSKVRDEKVALVQDVKVNTKKDMPPAPFDTTTFLAETTKLGFTPARALSVAESLYTRGYISYPRTDNTVYPKGTPFRRILNGLKKAGYSHEVDEILSGEKLSPTRGKKETTDHPPIHPEDPPEVSKLSDEERKIYDLVVRRFLATLAPPAEVRETRIRLMINDEPFLSKGVKITKLGWRKYYTWISKEEIEVPEIRQGDKVDVKEIDLLEKETLPPKRYTMATLLKEMEKRLLGTKSTRADIIQKIIDRGYVRGKTLRPTLTGRAVISALEDHAKKITESEMTARLEEDMEKIQEGRMKKEEVIDESRTLLRDIVRVLEENREEIRSEIREALRKENTLGKCPKCGGDLVIRKNRRNGKIFVGCSNYPKCSVTYPLPQYGNLYPTGEVCELCGTPVILVYPSRRRGKGRRLCLNPDCEENKKYWENVKKYSKKKEEQKEEE